MNIDQRAVASTIPSSWPDVASSSIREMASSWSGVPIASPHNTIGSTESSSFTRRSSSSGSTFRSRCIARTSDAPDVYIAAAASAREQRRGGEVSAVGLARVAGGAQPLGTNAVGRLGEDEFVLV